MRDAAIILPLRNAQGRDLADLHAELQFDLTAIFGGYAAHPVTGAWRDEATGFTYADDSMVYLVAADWTGKAPGKLERIGARIGARAGVGAVYIHHASGETVLVLEREPAPFLSKKTREALEAQAA